MNKKFLSFGIAFALVFSSISFAPFSETATLAACKITKPKGKTIGTISAGKVKMPIKAFNYPAGGIMEPQGTTLAAGLSQRHMPLSSTIGTSIITWHVNYNGCWNALNILMSQKAGFKFLITDENGDVKRYKIVKKLTVKKGDYKKSWFNLIGPRQLALFTCTGTFSKGHYTKNMVFIAQPLT